MESEIICQYRTVQLSSVIFFTSAPSCGGDLSDQNSMSPCESIVPFCMLCPFSLSMSSNVIFESENIYEQPWISKTSPNRGLIGVFLHVNDH